MPLILIGLFLAGCAYERHSSRQSMVYKPGGNSGGINIKENGTCDSDEEVIELADKIKDAWCGEDNFVVTSQTPSYLRCVGGEYNFRISGYCR